jgi:hypothetical protein
MNKQFLYVLICTFLNFIVVHIFLFAISPNKCKLEKKLSKKEKIIKRITGIAYWKSNSFLIKTSIIVLFLSFFFLIYAFIITLLEKVALINDIRFITIPLKIVCIIFAFNFIGLCIKLYAQ